MALYEYKCDACGHVFEKFGKRMSEATDDETCPRCLERAVRIYSTPAIVIIG